MNAAKAAAYSLIEQGPVPPPGFLGVGGIDVTRALAWAIGLPVSEGFGVTSIEPGSPAEEAGIELDDIIVQMNETVITDGQDLTEFLGEHPSGSSVKIVVVRDARLLVSLQGELSDEPER
jgi:S1-C subfamily serine protease